MNKTQESSKSMLWTGALIAIITAFITALGTSYFQHTFSRKEIVMKLYLENKMNFQQACEDYLFQYREWREIISYYLKKKDSDIWVLNKYDESSILDAYYTWAENFDRAYSKVFLASDSDFGTKTLIVSTALYNALYHAMSDEIDMNYKLELFTSADHFFFNEWLARTHDELNKYYSWDKQTLNSYEAIRQMIDLSRANEPILFPLIQSTIPENTE